MINIKYRYLPIRCETLELRNEIQKILNLLDYGEYDIGILLTDNATIKKYNKEYRDKDEPTDILSFSFHPSLKPGERIQPKTEEDKNLGDLIISLEYVEVDAPKWGQLFDERMRILFVHGICHLLGYKHDADEEYQVMKKQEDYLLEKLAKDKKLAKYFEQ
ncbi:MAG: rRNA maturation RNase YbeY [Candidatus Babeliales bacterium]